MAEPLGAVTDRWFVALDVIERDGNAGRIGAPDTRTLVGWYDCGRRSGLWQSNAS